MPTPYRIHFINSHGMDGEYAFFTQPPIVNGDPSASGVFTNVWIAKPVPDTGDFEIDTTMEFLAWVGTAPTTPGPGITIKGGISKPATLGTTTTPGSTYPLVNFSGTPEFGAMTQTASQSSFEIDTGKDFNLSDNFMLGLAQVDQNGHKVPVATIHADTEMKTQIEPIIKFYVSKFTAVQGQIVNFQSSSAQAGVIDFSTGLGLGKFSAEVTHNPDGTFTTTYASK